MELIHEEEKKLQVQTETKFAANVGTYMSKNGLKLLKE